jgi:hypothetical protein
MDTVTAYAKSATESPKKLEYYGKSSSFLELITRSTQSFYTL